MQIESLFKYDEIESLIKSTTNGKIGLLVNIMNAMLINHRLSSYRKEAVIQRIPKKNSP